MQPYLEVKGISKSYGDDRILDDLSLTVDKGKVVALLGPSGCGKTTLLRIIAGLVEQDKGRVFLEGKRMDGVPVHKRKVGFVFQNYSLFPHLNVRGNIGFGLKIRGYPPRRIDAKVDELLELIGLERLGKRRPSQLSGGQQQRVALARALAMDPKILLLDEPFGALDAKIRKRIRRDLKELQRKLGFTAVFVTHDQDEAFEVGDKIAVMNEGRIEQIGLPRDLYENPGSLFVAKFLGNINVMTIDSEEEEILVRPEDIEIDKGGRDGTLMSYVFLGPLIEVMVFTRDKQSIAAIMPHAEFIDKNLRRGDRLKVKVKKYRTIKECG